MHYFKTKHNCPSDLKELFPSRRQWYRPNLKSRNKFANTQDLNIAALYKTILTTHINVVNKKITPPEWYLKLNKFIYYVQERIKNPDNESIKLPIIVPIKKDDNKHCTVCRPISLYNLEDRVIISLTSKYLTDIFDPYLHNCSYAFRSVKYDVIRTHHDTITEIINYKERIKKGSVWVAECDLKKFFDCVNHELIINIFEKFVQKVEGADLKVSKSAIRIFLQYLNSYTFNNSVFKLNKTPQYFLGYNIPNGQFEWPYDELRHNFYDGNVDTSNIGVPQGGALSCLIANLILHDVDESVDSEPKDSDLLYIRFCDDMVIMHTEKMKCEEALKRYNKKIKSSRLLIHQPEDIVVYNKAFWKTKSKKPYKWTSRTNSGVPWVSFVGYQVRFDGNIRIRKKSLKKEVNKQKKEAQEVLKALSHNVKTQKNINESSRKSKKQQVYALESRLIAMSVGRVKLYNYKSIKPGLCWTNGFKNLNYNIIVKSQLRYLDRQRTVSINNFKRKLKYLTRATENPVIINKTYFGNPFSYHNFSSNLPTQTSIR
ncbi:Reverse transcriptase (RNA-dependent DNA polymerase) [Mucilaginibacter lappiensis]|nr:Reverse transcriptase (RNA-dependent DNA polymerase) [Mucilaginibacter lappiensis]